MVALKIQVFLSNLLELSNKKTKQNKNLGKIENWMDSTEKL